MNNGLHDPRPQPRGNRPGHDQAIILENKIRVELGGPKADVRGLFNDPNKGESLWKMKGAAKWLQSKPSPDDLKFWYF
jgi:hypothetical protein